MYVAVIPNRGSPPAILLRESYREAGKTKNRTLANLSGWPAERIAQLRAVLRGDKLLPATEAVEIVRALPHGHVLAALGTARRIALDTVLPRRAPPRRRDLALALIVARLLEPAAKLATARMLDPATASHSVRGRGLPGRGRGVRRQHCRSADPVDADRQAEAALPPAARGDGRRPRRADQRAHRADTAPGWSGLDHCAARSRHQAARRRRRAIAALAVHACPGEGRGPRHGGNHQPRLSGRTPGGVHEPVAGRRAGPQTRRTVGCHREGAGAHCGPRAAGAQCAARRRGDWPGGRRGA